MLIYIDDLYEISKDNFSKNLHLKVKNNAGNEYLVVIEFNFEFDDLTRSALLRRVNEIFKGVIETKKYNEDMIDEILDSYFSEVCDAVKNILFKKNEEKRDNCCSSCILI
jgi:ABC-type uncharacterized transport system substrate-binding protein